MHEIDPAPHRPPGLTSTDCCETCQHKTPTKAPATYKCKKFNWMVRGWQTCNDFEFKSPGQS